MSAWFSCPDDRRGWHRLRGPLGVGSPHLENVGRSLSEAMIEQLVEQIESRFAELEREMSDPDVIADRARYAEVGRAYRELGPARELAREYRKLSDDLEGARELLAEDGDDSELRAVVADAPARLEELEEEIRLAMVERDPNDDKNVLVEIRAGTGGDEAALFAGDLYKMLTRYAEEKGFRSEEHTSELQSRQYLVCRLLLEKKKQIINETQLKYI